jgi:hypothetical protein
LPKTSLQRRRRELPRHEGYRSGLQPMDRRFRVWHETVGERIFLVLGVRHKLENALSSVALARRDAFLFKAIWPNQIGSLRTHNIFEEVGGVGLAESGMGRNDCFLDVVDCNNAVRYLAGFYCGAKVFDYRYGSQR